MMLELIFEIYYLVYHIKIGLTYTDKDHTASNQIHEPYQRLVIFCKTFSICCFCLSNGDRALSFCGAHAPPESQSDYPTTEVCYHSKFQSRKTKGGGEGSIKLRNKNIRIKDTSLSQHQSHNCFAIDKISFILMHFLIK